MPENPSSDAPTRNRILLAAGPIFADKGFGKATVREICEAAAVNLASINYYFGDKKSLYIETVIHAREMRTQQFPDPPFSNNTPPEEKLSHIVTSLLNRLMALQTAPWQVRLIMREILEPTDALDSLVEIWFRPFFESLLLVVDELTGLPLKNSVRQQIGFSILGQCVHYRTSATLISILISEEELANEFQVDQISDHITTFSLGAIERFRQQHLHQTAEQKM